MELMGAEDENSYYTDEKREIGKSLTEAAMLAKDGQFNKSILLLDKILEKDPNEKNVLVNKGICFSQLGNYDEAISYYDKVLDINPNFSSALYNKAATKALIGQNEEALDLLEKALTARKSFIPIAKRDEDFLYLRSNPRFMSIVG